MVWPWPHYHHCLISGLLQYKNSRSTTRKRNCQERHRQESCGWMGARPCSLLFYTLPRNLFKLYSVENKQKLYVSVYYVFFNLSHSWCDNFALLGCGKWAIESYTARKGAAGVLRSQRVKNLLRGPRTQRLLSRELPGPVISTITQPRERSKY